ncbi:disease resistance RPP13-like protein 4 [Phragmites australis]|uniref:disease resistance RPP13-like protein 4 n=1 Tax=Phragmites australis TaxID=29695 RepID=UPI002D76CB24|nr:disease resistance RPP13-like protein 4 [Phragmites australis]
MSQEQTLEEVFSPFLMQLEKAKRVRLKPDEDSSLSDITLLFENIEKEAHEVKNILQRVLKWENEVINDFGGIARHLDDIIEEDSQLNSIRSKLQIVNTEMSNLKDRMRLPLHVPVIKPAAPTPLSSIPSKLVHANVSEQWKRLEIERKILESPTMSNLQLSYDNLDLQLKLCLLCFSIFPENSIISKRAMIHWWIGEGLVAATRSQTAEDVGNDCFEKLIAREMIEPVYQKRSCGVNQCKLHAWIRRMLITVARQARFFEFDSDGNATWDFSSTHRVCVVEEHQAEIEAASPRNQFDPDLLTIFNVNERYLQFEKSWFLDLRKIAVLQLGRWHNLYRHHIEVDSTEFLEGLQSSKQLKYLCLRGISRITELPASIGELSNLRILDLHACHNLERLSESIVSLQMLTHLDVSECYLLEGMPRGIGLLTELQVLKGFVIGCSTGIYNCRVTELTRLKNLKKLSIYIGSKVAVTENELNELENIKGLCVLKITWAVSLSKKGGAHQTSEATSLLTSLSLPPNLEKLDLRCFPGEKMPGWLSPSMLLRLKRLYFTGGMLSTFGDKSMSEAWNVEILRLKFLNDLSVQWTQVHDIFPNLMFLEVFKCRKLESFHCDKDGVWMNCGTQEVSK